MSTETLDVLAIGLGPFNLGLAALAEPTGLSIAVLESRDEFSWHPGMMIEGATIQVPFMADLVTMADPTSRYSFLNYLKLHDRLYPFYIRESFYPLRAEYDRYCRWVAAEVSGPRFGHHVEQVTYDADDDVFVAHYVTAQGPGTLRGRHLVVGVGTAPHLPPALAALTAEGVDVVHTGDYLTHRDRLVETDRVTVVGSGQSAAEVFHDLIQRRADDATAEGGLLTWVTRSPRFFPMEYTKLTLEMTSPEYVDHFHALEQGVRDRLGREQRNLYKGINGDLINAIHETLYEQSLTAAPAARLGTAQEVVHATRTDDGIRLDLRHLESGEETHILTDAVVAATGYASRAPELLAGLAADPATGIAFDESGRPAVTRGFTLDGGRGRVFIQNGEDHTHSVTAPDLGMGPHRNSVILNTILGREVYRVEERIAFQTFGALHD